jgi:hypothetical protein
VIGSRSFALYLFLRRKDFLNADLVNEVLTTQVNQMGSLFVVGQVRTDAVDHHHDESRLAHSYHSLASAGSSGTMNAIAPSEGTAWFARPTSYYPPLSTPRKCGSWNFRKKERRFDTDHLVGGSEQRVGHGEAEPLGGLTQAHPATARPARKFVVTVHIGKIGL